MVPGHTAQDVCRPLAKGASLHLCNCRTFSTKEKSTGLSGLLLWTFL